MDQENQVQVRRGIHISLGLTEIAAIACALVTLAYVFVIDIMAGFIATGGAVGALFAVYRMTRFHVGMLAMSVLKSHAVETRKLFAEADAEIKELKRQLAVKENAPTAG